MLYAGIRGLGHRFVFRNRSGGRHKLPDLVGRDFVREWQGKLLTEDWKNVEILLARFFRTNRNNMLWISPTTGWSMDMTPHSPHWIRYGPPR